MFEINDAEGPALFIKPRFRNGWLMMTQTCLALICILGLSIGCSDETVNRVNNKPAATVDIKDPLVTATPNKSDPTSSDTSAGNEGTTRPEQVTGAYMTATILTSSNPGSILVGIVGMIDDIRISDEPENYKTTWTLGFAKPLPVIVNLQKSQNSDFDQTLEFFGTREQFDQYAADIDVSLGFQQNLNGAIVSKVVSNTMAEITSDSVGSALLKADGISVSGLVQ